MRTPLPGFIAAIFSGALLAIPAQTTAYEAQTHQRLSRAAYDLSGIASTIQQIYGISPVRKFKGRLLSSVVDPHTAQDWVTIGGSHEDAPGWRTVNHFYDPISKLGLHAVGGAPAPDWALEDVGDMDGQLYSLKDARNAFYQGLTESDPGRRERELGHTFYSLGHVIHLLQDMAQPQHTRNDLHPPHTPLQSWTERYVEQNFAAFALTGAAIPPVRRARDLWTNASGSGFAQFVNANFVSAGTNFTALRDGAMAERYEYPKLDLSLRSVVVPSESCRDGVQAPADLTVFGHTFADPLLPDRVLNPRLTTYSVFDQYLVNRGKGLIFAINCFNIDANSAILLPRATAYLAALLRHFFRGRLEARLELRVGPDGRLTSDGLRIINRTPGETMMGRFEVYLDREDDTRIRLASWESLTLAPDDEAGSGVLEIPDRPGSTNLGRYLVVFRGQLGDEPDAVAGAFTAPAFFVVIERVVADEAVLRDGSLALPFDLTPGVPVFLAHSQSREQDPYGPELPGSSEHATLFALYRDPRAVPGDTAVVTVWGATCLRRIITGVEFVPFARLVIDESHLAAQADVVEFKPPERLAQFAEYHMPGPEVVRVLLSGITGPIAQGPTFRVGVGKLRFIGLRLTTPLPPGGGIGYQVSCGATVTVAFE
jgi:hypothetical protein